MISVVFGIPLRLASILTGLRSVLALNGVHFATRSCEARVDHFGDVRWRPRDQSSADPHAERDGRRNPAIDRRWRIRRNRSYHLFAGMNLAELGYDIVEHATSEGALHIVLAKA